MNEAIIGFAFGEINSPGSGNFTSNLRRGIIGIIICSFQVSAFMLAGDRGKGYNRDIIPLTMSWKFRFANRMMLVVDLNTSVVKRCR